MPGQTEIELRLMMLNKLQREWNATREAEIAQEKGIKNYTQWFRDNHIKIKQRRVGSSWEIVPKEEE